MRITFAKYAFKDLLELLQYSGITEVAITKEDDDLVVVISDKSFKKEVNHAPNLEPPLTRVEYDQTANLQSDGSRGCVITRDDIDPELFNAVKIVSKAMEAEGIFKPSRKE